MAMDLINFIKEHKELEQAQVVQGLFGNASRDQNSLYQKCLACD
jgi:hypothetical protein